MPSVLIVLSGVDFWMLKNEEKSQAGYWSEEFVAPHRIFKEAGFDITVATPGGVSPTADVKSFMPEYTGYTPEQGQELRDYVESLADLLRSPAKLEDVDAADYDAVFIPGGHSPMEDLHQSETLGKLLVGFDSQDKVVSAVCHGPAGLVSAVRDDGSWAFEGRKLTGFSNEEEAYIGFADRAPWLLESRLRELGGDFEATSDAWVGAKVVIDGNLITGSNPPSSEGVAQAVVDAVSAKS